MLESTEPRHRWQSCHNNKMANGDRAANYLHYKDARHNYSLLDSVTARRTLTFKINAPLKTARDRRIIIIFRP